MQSYTKELDKFSKIITSQGRRYLEKNKMKVEKYKNIFRHFENMRGKSSPQMRFSRRFITRCVPIAFTPTSETFFTSFEHENIFSAN